VSGFKRIVLILTLICFVLILSASYYWYKMIPVLSLRTHYPIVEITNQQRQIRLTSLKPEAWVELNSLSKHIYMSIVLREDWHFFDHLGVDFEELFKVIDQSIEKKALGRGASTITQQLIKNVFLTNERKITRKLIEIFYAIKLEQIFNKEKILEYYLNVIEFGPNIYGINQASQYYFNKPAMELNLKEAAFIAMVIPSPKRYSQSFRQNELTDFARARMDDILVRLRQAKIITDHDRIEAMQSLLSWERPPLLETSDLLQAVEGNTGGSASQVDGADMGREDGELIDLSRESVQDIERDAFSFGAENE